jgi:OOP family OmpA-OmpF porin
MDGVVDRNDRCPGTPKGAVVDEHGCPIDSDGDGVFDGIDKCPDTPKKVKVDKKGCPKDSDGDGVFDGLDKCPDTPKKASVDKRGCPTDTDGDGVLDGIDKCPDTKRDLDVDRDGCPIPTTETEMQLLDTGMIRTTMITFETGKADIKPSCHPVLDEIGGVLVEWPALEIEIGGHTDSQGSEKFNAKLSEQRAAAVRSYLVEKYPKINPGKLSVKGYGESTPIADNATEKGRAKNRRVEFTVLNKEELKRGIERKGFKRK